jgi:two-component system, OmpR family, KDP operon response regulator KdpE
MRILVVDDDPDILRLCAHALRAQGHTVTTCEAGGEALAAALDASFDLALCDLNLPDVHGLEIVRAIKLQVPALPVIVMTALDPREWREKSVEAGADHFMSKPLRLDALRHEVRMAEASMVSLAAVIYVIDKGDGEVQRLAQAFEQAGFPALFADAPGEVIEAADAPDLVVIDAEAPGAEGVIRWARAPGIRCFVFS